MHHWVASLLLSTGMCRNLPRLHWFWFRKLTNLIPECWDHSAVSRKHNRKLLCSWTSSCHTACHFLLRPAMVALQCSAAQMGELDRHRSLSAPCFIVGCFFFFFLAVILDVTRRRGELPLTRTPRGWPSHVRDAFGSRTVGITTPAYYTPTLHYAVKRDVHGAQCTL